MADRFLNLDWKLETNEKTHWLRGWKMLTEVAALLTRLRANRMEGKTAPKRERGSGLTSH